MNSISVLCKNTGEYIAVEGGTTLAQLAEILAPKLGFSPICCRVNNKTEGLDYAIYQPRQLEFHDKQTGSGPSVYVRSLCMMLYHAVETVAPGTELTIEHSISHGYYCRLSGYDDVPDSLVAALKEHLQNLAEADLPFKHYFRPTAEVLEMFEKRGLHSKAELLRTTRKLYSGYYTLGDVCDSYYSALAPSTGHIKVFDLVKYKEGVLLLAFDPAEPSQPARPVAQEKMFKAYTDHLLFNRIVGVRDVGELNRYLQSNDAADLVNVAEALHEKAIARISDEIAARYVAGGARIVFISGPSSSGKTTTMKRLSIQLMTSLLKPQMISLDDYFVNRDRTPLDEKGDYDYESLYALDLEQFNTDLAAVLEGKEVALPTYNFETGRREYRGNTIKLEQGSILLIEGIHGLNPELTALIPEEMKFRVYVSALTTLSLDNHNWVPSTDNRLLRRIIRDHQYRGSSAESTIRRWPSVRRGEEKWIFP